ncbi:hypothetical protein [Corallococcus terminator]|nr:hypothetical protein [Corallococcus terminator]
MLPMMLMSLMLKAATWKPSLTVGLVLGFGLTNYMHVRQVEAPAKKEPTVQTVTARGQAKARAPQAAPAADLFGDF